MRALHRFSPVRVSPQGLVTLLILCLSPVVARPGTTLNAKRSLLLPTSWGGAVTFGWDSNLLQSSPPEKRAFETPDPDHLFLVDRLEGWQGNIGVWGRWEVRSFYKKLRIEAAYLRSEWPGNGILGYDRYDLSIRQKLTAASTLDLSARYEPQVYLRHRVDKDARPGDPRFRPEAYRGTGIGIAYARAVSTAKVSLLADYQIKDEGRWFNERDEKAASGGLSLQLPVLSKASLTSLYEFGRARSRNKPDLGSDRSNREHTAGLRLQAPVTLPGGPWGFEVGTKLKLRSYTTNDPTNQSRYHRKDRIYSWSVRWDRPGLRLTPFLTAEGAGRTVNLPAGVTVSDEEGEYTDTLIRSGIEWQF